MELLFHAPCFDGLGSAVLALDLLRSGAARVEPRPIGYGAREQWLSGRPADGEFGVVDFLYHPSATTFLTDAARSDYEARRAAGARVWWEAAAPSCADLLWRRTGCPPEEAESVADAVVAELGRAHRGAA